jgi:hypothetical protein
MLNFELHKEDKFEVKIRVLSLFNIIYFFSAAGNRAPFSKTLYKYTKHTILIGINFKTWASSALGAANPFS